MEWLNGQGHGLGALVLELQSQVSGFRGMREQERGEHMDRFQNAAGALPPFFQDTDIGALVLEEAADNTRDVTLKRFLYTEALYRAQRCAQAATSGGEGLARSRHVEDLEIKLAYAT